jgi:hypothetical protein
MRNTLQYRVCFLLTTSFSIEQSPQKLLKIYMFATKIQQTIFLATKSKWRLLYNINTSDVKDDLTPVSFSNNSLFITDVNLNVVYIPEYFLQIRILSMLSGKLSNILINANEKIFLSSRRVYFL